MPPRAPTVPQTSDSGTVARRGEEGFYAQTIEIFETVSIQ
jgi:hypothetical protein